MTRTAYFYVCMLYLFRSHAFHFAREESSDSDRGPGIQDWTLTSKQAEVSFQISVSEPLIFFPWYPVIQARYVQMAQCQSNVLSDVAAM
jgi:hypothetical protein